MKSAATRHAIAQQLVAVLASLGLLFGFNAISSGASAQSAEKFFEQAYDEFEAGNYELAEKIFEQGLKLQPNNGVGYYYLAETEAKLGRAKKTILSHYEMAAQLSPNSKEGIRAAGKAALLRDDIVKLEEYAKEELAERQAREAARLVQEGERQRRQQQYQEERRKNQEKENAATKAERSLILKLFASTVGNTTLLFGRNSTNAYRWQWRCFWIGGQLSTDGELLEVTNSKLKVTYIDGAYDIADTGKPGVQLGDRVDNPETRSATASWGRSVTGGAQLLLQYPGGLLSVSFDKQRNRLTYWEQRANWDHQETFSDRDRACRGRRQSFRAN